MLEQSRVSNAHPTAITVLRSLYKTIMEELLELRELLQHGQIEDALLLVDDLEEMGKKGITNNIRSYAKVLLLHLIKQQVEKRTTKSWDVSIHNCLTEIKYLNQKPKGKGKYLNNEELYNAISDAWDSARQASIEAVEGIYEVQQIEQMVNEAELIKKAYQLVRGVY